MIHYLLVILNHISWLLKIPYGWIKTMLYRSGVDTSKFTAGSVRPAAVSKAKAMSIFIACIMSKAGWTR